MKYAIIDIGSNSIRMSVYRYDEEDGNVYIQFKDKIMAGLAGHIEEEMLTDKGIQKACNALKIYKRVLQNLNISNIYPFATASLRNIKNSDWAKEKIKKETGFEVDIISGQQEAELDFEGATKILDIDKGILVDIGGGSTELVLYENHKIIEAASIPVGSLNMYKRHVKNLIPTKEERKFIAKDVKKEIEKLNIAKDAGYNNMCGVGGSIRATRKLSVELLGNDKLNKEVSVEEVKILLGEFESEDKVVIDKILQIVPERIHTIIPGMIILNTVARKFGTKRIYISSYGVREGYLYRNVLGK